MPTPDKLWYANVEYTFTGILTNPNVSYEKKMEARVGYREKGNTKRFYECQNDIYVKDDGHMAVDHAFSGEFAGKDMEVVFYFNTPDNGIVIAIKLEPAYLLESTYIHDHLQSITSEITEGLSEEETHSIHTLYTAIADGSIPNPTIRVERTPSINTVAKYDKSTQEIIVNDVLLYRIQDDEEQKLELLHALAETYSNYLNHTLDIEDLGVYECELFSANGIESGSIIIGKLTSLNYTGDLMIDSSEKNKLLSSKWEKDGAGESVYKVNSYQLPCIMKIEYNIDDGFKISTHVNNTAVNKGVNLQKVVGATTKHFSQDSDSEVAYTYYVGGDNFDGFGLLGHTSVGYSGSKDQNKTTLYAPLSGNSTYREDRKDEEGKTYSGVSEANTIKSYLDMGDIVERYHYSLPDSVMSNFVLILEGELKNPGSVDGAWCTQQAYDIYYLSYIEAGYSEEEATENAKKIINHTTPQELSRRQILNSGSNKYDKFYKKDEKYYQEVNTYTDIKNNSFNSWSKLTIEIKF